MVLKATVYNLRRSVRFPWNRPPCIETTEPKYLLACSILGFTPWNLFLASVISPEVCLRFSDFIRYSLWC